MAGEKVVRNVEVRRICELVRNRWTGVPSNHGESAVQFFRATAGVPITGTVQMQWPGGGVSTPISAGADAASVEAALESIPEIGSGNVLVVGDNLPGGFTFIFQSSLRAQEVPQLLVVNNTFIPPTVVVNTIARQGFSGSLLAAEVGLFLSPDNPSPDMDTSDFQEAFFSTYTRFTLRDRFEEIKFREIGRYCTLTDTIIWPTPASGPSQNVVGAYLLMDNEWIAASRFVEPFPIAPGLDLLQLRVLLCVTSENVFVDFLEEC